MKTGRNDPCPCGSGKKYKRCCMSKLHAENNELEKTLSDQEFVSGEVQANGTFVIERSAAKQNQKSQSDFPGLSSEHVFRMINFAFDTPKLFRFYDPLPIEPDAPILMLVEGIVSAIDDNGLKATKTKGNLPQKLCKELWSDYSKLYSGDVMALHHKVNSEDDFIELHVTRIVLELAGFLCKVKERFYLTKKYQKIASESGLKGLYPAIFKIYCSKFNWSYWDGYGDVPFIQQSFLFTLYLLKLHGEKMVLTSVYEDDFLRAFPKEIGKMDKVTHCTPEEQLRRCYHCRAHSRFLEFLGLAELEAIKGEKLYEYIYKIKKTPLFDAVIHFNFLDPKIDKAINSNINNDDLH